MAYTKFHATAAGNTTLVAAPGSGQRIAVTALFFQCGALTQVQLRNGTAASGSLTGAMQFSTGGGLNLPFVASDFYLFNCDDNQPFVVNLAGLAPDCAGALMYEVVPV